MNFSLSLRIGESVQGAVFKMGIVAAQSVVRVKGDLFSCLRVVLRELIDGACITGDQIREVFLAVDFPELFARQELRSETIGYLRYLPHGEKESKVLLPLKKLVQSETVTDFRELEGVFRKYKGKLTTFAINPEISAWFDVTEEVIKPMVHKVLGESAILSLGSSFNQIGFKARENMLLLNTLLLPGTNTFYDDLRVLLGEEMICARIFTMRNNGMFMNETWARKFPLYTVEVQFVADLLSLSGKLQTQSVLGIIRKRDKLYWGKVERQRPELSRTPLNLLQLSILLPHPIIGSSRLFRDQGRGPLEEIQKDLSPFNLEEENLPVIFSGLNEEWRHIVGADWRNYPKPLFLEPDPIWSRYAPICYECEVFVPYHTQEGDLNRNQRVRKMWSKLSEEAKADGFTFDRNWETFWEERPIRYLPGEASLIRLGYFR